MGIPVNGTGGDKFAHGNKQLGPVQLATDGSDPIFHFLLLGYSRFGSIDVQQNVGKSTQPGPGGEVQLTMAHQWKWPNTEHDGFLLDDNGQPILSSVTLNVGDLVDHFGNEDIHYFASFATPFSMRSLLTANLNLSWFPYGAYRVTTPIKVMAGLIAPGFEQPGLGTQYKSNLGHDELQESSFSTVSILNKCKDYIIPCRKPDEGQAV